ncbi:site-specific tyrosine recombinase XerD [Galbitalea sp. SE-J8]|uniref:site-specific tyrosine recombinase XerD n=1 Tax=Galbitalea sp. SE-J8 TaxID=3054952 RepID=UPI00259CC3D4|nr:site-specific tyrosine recombinase XerD [Galbitalea sp. SE-J8]MDM4764306.1 site-specific tyrosine recombinase XerD [Galbitalea sp. SE-J8]
MERAVDRYLRHVAIERGLSANTVAAYRRDLAMYTAHVAATGVTDAAAIVPADVTAFAVARAGLAPTSRARILSSVRGFHRFLLEEGLVAVDATADIAPPKQPKRLPKALTHDQVDRLLAATEGDDPVRLRDRALLELLYATGARISEATGLSVDDVLDAHAVRLTGKGNKQRIVPLGSYARAAIEAYLVRARPLFAVAGRGSAALFLGVRGAPLSRQSAWLVLRDTAARAQLRIDHLSPHSLRHTFATHLLEGGADVRVVQELLGHASVATTQIYTLVTADTLRDMYVSAHPRAR